jgi:taurine dioxygenase
MKIIPLPNALGAEVRDLDLGREIPDAVFESLYQAYLDHLLLLFRGQRIDDAGLLRAASRFGELMMPPAAHERSGSQVSDAPPEITVVSNVKVGGVAIGELGDGEVVWHSDYSFKEVIGGMRVLHGVKIPPHSAGGSTAFANMYAAFDELPAALRSLALEGFIRHDTRYDTNRNLRVSARAVGAREDPQGPLHPIASTHPETGSNSLFLGRRLAHGIAGMVADRSDALLDALWAHATQAHFSYEHFWQPGDVVLWDNRCTMHRRGPFDATQERILHAAQVKGHRPFRAVEAQDKPAHPRAAASRQRAFA